MDITKYGVPFFVVAGVVALLVASPALSRLLVYPRTEFFTEMGILGSGHKAEGYPFNVSSGQSYGVYLGIGNNLGYCAYYLVEVKFRNESMSMPSSLGPVESRTPSSLASLYNITAFVADEGSWELPVSVSFDYGYNDSLLQVDFHGMHLNDNVLSLEGVSTTWNMTTSRFYGDLVFELWLYSSSTSNFQFNGRFVDLKLNMTVT